MTIDQQIESARAELYRSIETNCAIAKIELKKHAARAMDEIRVQVGWMIRSDAQLRRFRNARNAKQ